ncbi:NAD(P)-dependent oxidoreductase [Amycolatopsis pithecellobii]|nr:NAD(P)-dependent oxidoreductase [Amycolatopsis pithecellobii]
MDGAPIVVLSRNLSDPDAQRWLAGRARIRIGALEELTEAEGLIAVWPTVVDRALLARAPRLRVIATVTAGTEHVDLRAAEERGITVVSGAGAAPDAVIEWAIWAMIGLSRRFAFAARRFDDGTWDWRARFADGRSHQLTGRTLGVVGLGHIGRGLAHVASATFGMRVLGFDPYADPVPGVTATSFDELLDGSDIVSLHLPLTDATRGLIGRDELQRIGPDGILIDASRGGVVSENAVIEALRTGELGAAALDVFSEEPPSAATVSGLVATGRVVLTPHAAGVSTAALRALNRRAVEQVIAVLRP